MPHLRYISQAFLQLIPFPILMFHLRYCNSKIVEIIIFYHEVLGKDEAACCVCLMFVDLFSCVLIIDIPTFSSGYVVTYLLIRIIEFIRS